MRKVLYDCELPIPGDRMFEAKSNGTVQQIEKLRQMLKHYGNPTDLKKFLLPDGPDGLVWDSTTEKYSYKSREDNGSMRVLDEDTESRDDYASRDAWAQSMVFKKVRGDSSGWPTLGRRKYIDFENDIMVDQYKWMRVISDGQGNDNLRPTTSVGRILVNKSIMVYFYSIIAAQTSYGGWSEATRGLIQESFAKNVNSFTTNQPRFESRNLNDYYKFAKLNSRTIANFSLGDCYLLLPRDMQLKQTEKSKKVYNVDKKEVKKIVKKSVRDGLSDGVSVNSFKPKGHNVEKVVIEDKHVPIKREFISKETGIELVMAAVGVGAAYLFLR